MAVVRAVLEALHSHLTMMAAEQIWMTVAQAVLEALHSHLTMMAAEQIWMKNRHHFPLMWSTNA